MRVGYRFFRCTRRYRLRRLQIDSFSYMVFPKSIYEQSTSVNITPSILPTSRSRARQVPSRRWRSSPRYDERTRDGRWTRSYGWKDDADRRERRRRGRDETSRRGSRTERRAFATWRDSLVFGYILRSMEFSLGIHAGASKWTMDRMPKGGGQEPRGRDRWWYYYRGQELWLCSIFRSEHEKLANLFATENFFFEASKFLRKHRYPPFLAGSLLALPYHKPSAFVRQNSQKSS